MDLDRRGSAQLQSAFSCKGQLGVHLPFPGSLLTPPLPSTMIGIHARSLVERPAVSGGREQETHCSSSEFLLEEISDSLSESDCDGF